MAGINAIDYTGHHSNKILGAEELPAFMQLLSGLGISLQYFCYTRVCERGIIMTKKKASMSQVLADIKTYIMKKFMAAPCVKEQDIQAICQILLPRYKNVQLMQGLTNNKPDFRIQVKSLFGTEEKRFEVVGGDKKRLAAKKKSDLGWIDRLEEIDAALDDF